MNELMEFLKSKGDDGKKTKLERTASKPKDKIGTETEAGLKLDNDTIAVMCPCGQRLVAKKELAGKTVRCPRCSEAVVLPGPTQIDVSCRHCGQRFMAREELAGKTVKCPMCTRPLMVPTPGVAQAVAKPIEVACTCGQEFVAKPDLAGKTVKCISCGAALVIPNHALN